MALVSQYFPGCHLVTCLTPSMENKLPFVSCARDTVLCAGDALYTKQRAISALVEPGSRILKKAVIKDKTRIRKT